MKFISKLIKWFTNKEEKNSSMRSLVFKDKYRFITPEDVDIFISEKDIIPFGSDVYFIAYDKCLFGSVVGYQFELKSDFKNVEGPSISFEYVVRGDNRWFSTEVRPEFVSRSKDELVNQFANLIK